MLTVLDLFSGIGGFSLGLERTGGFRTVAFCEVDPFCQAVLRKHWPEVPIFDDVRPLTADQLRAHGAWPIDVVTGGFPCQPYSSAARGRRRGADDPRALWPAMRRLVAEVRPAWVCAENVAHFDGLGLDEVVLDLAALGYAVAPPCEIPACAVGCDHWRPRLWILGYADRDRESGGALDGEVARLPRPRGESRGVGAADGLPRRMDRLRALGNAVVPGIVEVIGQAILAAEPAS